MRDGGAAQRAVRRPRGGLLRLSAVVLAVLTVALCGQTPPSPRLDTVSTQDPAPPASVVVTGADRALVVSWTASTETATSGYQVFLDAGTEPQVTTNATTRTATLTGLVNGRQYTVTVRTVTTQVVLFVPRTYVGQASAPAGGTPRDTVAPAAPTGVGAARGDGRVTLSWTANSGDYDVDGYRVFRDGVEVATTTGTTFTDTALVNDRTYVYTVQTNDTSGNWSASSVPSVSATPTDLTPPAPPTGLVGGRGDGRAGLSWAAGPEPDLASYRVLRDGVEVATVPGTAYLDPGLVNDRTYTYTLVAVDGHGNRSAPSAAVQVTPTDLTPPAAPTGLTAVRGDGQVTLSWAAGPEPDLASYRVLRDGVEVAVVTGATTHTDTALVNDTTYRYTLAAVDTHGNRSISSAAVTATPHELDPPAPPTGLAATAGDRRVDLSWAAGPETDLASYRVLRDGAVLATVTDATAYTDTAVVNDTTYAYAVVAVDTHDNASAPSETVRATPADRAAPAPPPGFTATRGDGRVDLSWTANGEPDVAGYRVLRDGAVLTTGTGTAYSDTTVVNDTTYTYALVAVDTSGNASDAATASARPTDLTAPVVPTGVTAVDGGGRVSLSWTTNTEPDLAGYVLLRDGTEVASVPGTSYVDHLADDAAHSYAVVAVDTSGNRSAPSATAEVPAADRLAPAAPTGLVATAGDGRVTLTWTANDDPDLAGYVVLRDGARIATVPGTTYTDTGVVNDTTYSYALVAVDTSGNVSGPSGAAAAEPTDLTPPAVPAGFTAVRGDGLVELSWTANPEADVASFRVLRDGVEVATVTGVTSYTDAGLVNDRTYGYALVSVDTSGNRSGSVSVSATPTDLTAPAAPAGFTAVRGDGQVTLSWTASTEPDLGGYVLLRDGVQIATPAGPTHLDPGLVNDRRYAYALVVVDTHGNRSDPATADATPTDLTPPPAPTGVTATSGDRQAVLGWDAGGVDVAEHRVLDADGSTVVTVPAPGTSGTVTGLANDTTYAFTVVAVDAGGNVSARSAAVSVTPVYAVVPVEGAGESGGVAASGDGRFVVVGTRARLESSDTNTAYELYVVDRTAGTRTRIAPLPATTTGAGDATNTSVPAVSDDGRYVVLATTAALDPGDTNGLADVYRYDVGARSWALVSAPQRGTASPSVAGTLLQPAASVYTTAPSVAVSGDGDLVLFHSARADLVPGDTNNRVDVFAKRLSDGTVTRVSTTTTGGELSGPAMGPALALTPDGRFAVFGADSASGVIAHRKTLSGAGTGELRVVSQVTTSTGRTLPFAVHRDTGDLAVSDDGRYVALVTSNRVTTAFPAQTWPTGLAYRVDTGTGAVVPLGTGQTTVWEHQVELDPTGRHAFFSTAAAVLPADTNGHTDHYRRDLDGGVPGPLVLVTADASGRPTAGPPGAITPAEYGRVLAITGDRVLVTTSQPLTAADVNRLRDVYTKDLLTGAVGVGLG
ncbi:fibronectin type 3 domain-containing protein [Geodermatophilus obscurus]|uniref:Fibronectin type 3 domain-containing protein n=1 Tax=Geodermatophilus obscurus TaxID=1861 RepID=A0A1M7SYF5_9ACTN|nr:fibronectin type III domain-containing protein [Geodermatophilus obscurus]SHN63421.1 fibronectin type 3 domain-containing protein [Geodermatophilus obscurus]